MKRFRPDVNSIPETRQALQRIQLIIKEFEAELAALQSGGGRNVTLTDPLSPNESIRWDEGTQMWVDDGRDAVVDASTLDKLELLGDFHNGTFLETMDADLTSDGATVTMSLQKNGGGDLTMVFSDGQTVLNSSGATTGSITLTPGTFEVPTKSFVYILSSDKILTENTSDWPTAEHI